MDLKQRIEELTEVSESLKRLQKLNAEVEQYKVQIEEAMKKVKVDGKGKIVDANDQIFVDRLNHLKEAAEKRAAEEATKFNETKEKVVEALRADTDAELSLYRESGERGYETQNEAMKRVGNPYMTGKTEIEMKNYERRMQISRAEAARAANEEKLAEIEKQIAEAVANKAHFTLGVLNEQKANLLTDIALATSVIESLSQPFKSIDENEAEYTAVYNIWKSMEEILDPEKQDAVVALDSIQATIDALHELEEIQEASIPAQTRYDDLKSKMDALKVQKAEAKKAMENIKKGLDNGTITGQYVESSKARLAELEAEVAACEAQEKENTEKMKRLEEEYGLKPKDRDEGDDKGKGEGGDKGKGEGEGTGKGEGDASLALQKLNGLLARRDEISAAMDAIQAEMNKKTEEIARESDADKGKALSQELSDLQAKYKKLNIEKNKVNIQIADLEKKLDEAEATKGKGKDDDDGKPKTDAEKKKALEEEYAKLDDEYKRLEAELVKKRAELQLAPDNEALKQEITKLQEEQQKVWRDRNGKKIQIGSLEKKIKDAEEAARQGGSGKGNDKPVPVKGDEYYDSLSPWEKYKMKKEAFQLTEGIGAGDMSFFRKALLFLPSNKYSTIAGRMLSSGEMRPLQRDIPMLEEAAKAEAEEAAKKAAAARDPFDTLTPEQKAKAQEEAAKAAKAQEEAARGGKPQQEQPKREGGER